MVVVAVVDVGDDEDDDVVFIVVGCLCPVLTQHKPSTLSSASAVIIPTPSTTPDC